VKSFKEYIDLSKGVEPSPKTLPDGSPLPRKPNPKWFKKGQSGNLHPPGSPTPKSRARLKVLEILEMYDFNPFEKMISLYESTNKDRIKVDILTELCGYLAPKLKSMELSGDKENPFIINLNITPGQPRQQPVQVIDQAMQELISADDDDDEQGA